MYFFVLLTYVSLAASRTLFAMITSMSECYSRFRIQIQIYSGDTNKKSYSYELMQHKQLKTLEMSEAWPDIFNEPKFGDGTSLKWSQRSSQSAQE